MSKLEQMTAQAQINLAYDSLQASYDEEYKDYLFAQQATAHAQVAQAISLNEINQRASDKEFREARDGS